jgi:hypothetical protein
MRRLVILKAGSAANEVISKDQIAKWVHAPSSMPGMKTILTKKEIRCCLFIPKGHIAFYFLLKS